MDINTIIDGLGGTNAVASHIGREPSVVCSWKRGKRSVPHWWADALLERAKIVGFALTKEQIPVTPPRLTKAGRA